MFNTVRMERGSEAWRALDRMAAQASEAGKDFSVCFDQAAEGALSFKVGEGMWTPPLSIKKGE